MSTAPADTETKPLCSYEDRGWHCPFDAEPGHTLCIFHLPVEQKKPEDFWQHLALYLSVLYCCVEGDEASKFWKAGKAWFVGAAAPAGIELKEYYKMRAWGMNPWRFRGFVFPAMDDAHNLDDFVFRDCDFSRAEFPGAARLSNARFSAVADFIGAKFSAGAYFRGAKFGAEAWFISAEFSAGASFGGAKFSAGAWFMAAKFNSETNFMGAEFSGEAHFGPATFSGKACFRDATFGGEAGFGGAVFSGEADFRRATFGGKADFRHTTFSGKADFPDATFSGPAYLSRATVNDLLDFSHVTLRNRLLFEGTTLADTARVLLWGLDFVHGTTDITMEKEHLKGQLVEPAGQVVFRDITSGINCVSLLHTDILTDRLCVRFANVRWEHNPREFIFDARFAFCKTASEWQKATGLAADVMKLLPELFHAGRPVPPKETDEEKRQREARQMADCLPLVRQDVERIAREIRLSYEKYGHYGDAGDYYVAEMDFRRKRTPRFRVRFPELTHERRWPIRIWRTAAGFLRSLSSRSAMDLYRLVSLYGESPRRALTSLLAALAGFGFAFVIAGFKFMGSPVDRDLRLDPSQFVATLSDMWLAVRMALANLMPGNLRGDVLGLELTSPATKTWAVAQVIVTYVLLTLLLLAIRRRFRR